MAANRCSGGKSSPGRPAAVCPFGNPTAAPTPIPRRFRKNGRGLCHPHHHHPRPRFRKIPASHPQQNPRTHQKSRICENQHRRRQRQRHSARQHPKRQQERHHGRRAKIDVVAPPIHRRIVQRDSRRPRIRIVRIRQCQQRLRHLDLHVKMPVEKSIDEEVVIIRLPLPKIPAHAFRPRRPAIEAPDQRAHRCEPRALTPAPAPLAPSVLSLALHHDTGVSVPISPRILSNLTCVPRPVSVALIILLTE